MTHLDSKKEKLYDLLILGEVMLRFDPGDKRIRNADTFRVWEGGGEYNVARGFHTCFNKKSAVVTSLVDNEIGRLVQSRIKAGGVDDSFIHWVEDDGIGEKARNGVYYLERGFGLRNPLGASDRAHTAISQLKPGMIDWEMIFGKLGVRWFHTGGIFAGLSENSPEVILEAIAVARKYDTIISYDLNYRHSVWQRHGGRDAAREVNGRILKHVDFLFGFDSLEKPIVSFEEEPFKKAISEMARRFPNLIGIASTMRHVKSACAHDWSGLLLTSDQFYRGITINDLEILDRVGGGDAFVSGLLYSYLEKMDPQQWIDHAVAHGALTMTTPGDNSMSTLNEVKAVIAGQKADVIR